MENYTNKAEQTLLELQTAKQERDKMLLLMEIVIGSLSVIILLSFVLFASFLNIKIWLRIALITLGFIIALASTFFALKIEQVAGYYICKKCNHKYVPTYKQVFFAMHCGRTRYMKCPHCKQKSWNKKVVK